MIHPLFLGTIKWPEELHKVWYQPSHFLKLTWTGYVGARYCFTRQDGRAGSTYFRQKRRMNNGKKSTMLGQTQTIWVSQIRTSYLWQRRKENGQGWRINSRLHSYPPEATSSKKEFSYSEAVDEPIEKAIVSPEFIARTWPWTRIPSFFVYRLI